MLYNRSVIYLQFWAHESKGLAGYKLSEYDNYITILKF